MEKRKTQKGVKKSAKVDVKKETKVVEEVSKKTESKVETKVDTVVKPKRDYSLFKILVITILIAVVLTWIIPSGAYSNNQFEISTRVRTGINELFLSTFYSSNYYLIQIFTLFVIGAFYGIISKTKGYAAMISNMSKMWKGKEKLFVIVNSLIIALMVSVFSHPLVVLVFVPMIYSVAKKLNLSKMSVVAMCFGSMFIGLMGTTYSSYGIDYINSYMGTEITTLLGVRFGILAIGFLLLNIFIIFMEKNNKNSQKVEEIFEVSEEKGKGIGYFIIFGILFALSILAYVPWETIFDNTVFTDFNTWLTTNVTIGDHAIFGYILGNVAAFGHWDLFNICAVLLIIAIIVKFASKIKWDEIFDRSLDGMKKMLVPVILTIFAYSMFVICYWSGMTATIVNFFNSADSFNPLFNAVGNICATLFHVDFGYSGFALGTYYASKFADNVNQIMVIMTSINGLVSFIAPTSVLMLIGLSLGKVSYKEWFKYIWKLLVALLIVLVVIFAII